MKKSFVLALLVTALFLCCKKDDNKALLLGQWQGVSWKVRGEESGRNFGAVRFEFNTDDTYSAAFGDQLERGTFRLSGDKLYTTGENKIEKMVKLSRLSADTLVMDMNRVGVSEELVLAKQH